MWHSIRSYYLPISSYVWICWRNQMLNIKSSGCTASKWEKNVSALYQRDHCSNKLLISVKMQQTSPNMWAPFLRKDDATFTSNFSLRLFPQIATHICSQFLTFTVSGVIWMKIGLRITVLFLVICWRLCCCWRFSKFVEKKSC